MKGTVGWFLVVVGTMLSIMVLWAGCSIIGGATWFASRTVDVVQQQIDPAELLRKYEWFKNAAAALDAKQADIHVYQVKIDSLHHVPNLDRTDREQLMVWEQEVAGIKASYNDLASDYNAQMAKINWRFCNVGGLPQGASTPLPREFKPYQEN